MPKTNAKPVESTDVTPVVIVVEDNVVVRDALRGMLEQSGFEVDDYSTGEDFLEAFQPSRGACVLIDAQLPGLSGINVLKQITRIAPNLPAIMITGGGDIKTAVAAMKAGAVDFIQKPIGQQALASEVERVIDLSRDANKASDWRKAAADRLTKLTPRQRDILQRILNGERNKNISADLKLSQRTVENHRALIMRKVGAKSLPDLTRIVYFAEGGIAQPWATSVDASANNVQAASGSDGTIDDGMESENFGRYFDQVPLAIVIANIAAVEQIVYANPAYESLTGQAASEVKGMSWQRLPGQNIDAKIGTPMGIAIAGSANCVGTFTLQSANGGTRIIEAYSNIIADDDGKPLFRLAALVEVSEKSIGRLQEFEEQMLVKDALLLEIQHRVKNNLQMITALIRAEARNVSDEISSKKFNRLAGRINSIQIIYRLLSEFSDRDEIDLGVYLSEIAASVMHAHGTEGISLNLKVDSYPVSVNVALPTGLVANELLTNAIKHAFVGRERGTITLHSLTDQTGCRVIIADDGIGLPPGTVWPKRGKLGELIVRSLRQNAKADLEVVSHPHKGTCVTISFTRASSRAASNFGPL
jgi:PAS domain S-box-containing protein